MFKKFFMMMVCFVLGLGSPAMAQGEDPNELLDASRKAISEMTGFAAQFKMFGDGDKTIKAMMPSMEGQMIFGEHPEYGMSLRMTGKSRDKQDAAPNSMDMLRSNSAIVWLDYTERTIDEHPADTRIRTVPTSVKLMMFDSLLDEDPYGDRMDQAESIELEERKEVNGELCHVVRVNYAKSKAGGRSTSFGNTHNAARWFISVEDMLPRRIEYVTTGMMRFQLVTELSNFELSDPSPEQIDVMRLPGFELKSTLNQSAPEEVKAPSKSTQTSAPTAPAKTTSRSPRAPAFEFTNDAGATINNASQRGRVTVLYFCGSWALPCREVTPMISELAEEFSDSSVDVYGLSIRERDPEAVRETFEMLGYKHELITTADALVESFDVSLFPTIVVIDSEGGLVATHKPKVNIASEDMIAKVRESVSKLVNPE